MHVFAWFATPEPKSEAWRDDTFYAFTKGGDTLVALTNVGTSGGTEERTLPFASLPVTWRAFGVEVEIPAAQRASYFLIGMHAVNRLFPPMQTCRAPRHVLCARTARVAARPTVRLARRPVYLALSGLRRPRRLRGLRHDLWLRPDSERHGQGQRCHLHLQIELPVSAGGRTGHLKHPSSRWPLSVPSHAWCRGALCGRLSLGA